MPVQEKEEAVVSKTLEEHIREVLGIREDLKLIPQAETMISGFRSRVALPEKRQDITLKTLRSVTAEKVMEHIFEFYAGHEILSHSDSGCMVFTKKGYFIVTLTVQKNPGTGMTTIWITIAH